MANTPRRVIITFLGTSPRETTYQHAGAKYAGRVFAEALRQFQVFDHMFVCTTSEAESTTWPAIESLNDARIENVPIPTGQNTVEMWDMFKRITEKVQDGDVVTFDITHGLRSLPFLVFLFAAYLKAARDIKIESVLYGALELGRGVPAPVINLSEFVGMFDWITATNQFVERGDGQQLADQLADQPDLSQAIRDMSLCLSLSRPLGAMSSAARLKRLLDDPATRAANDGKPFGVLADQVRDAYAGFALLNPRDDATLHQNLRNQSGMIQWYLKRYQYVQAVTLARELLISLAGFALNVCAQELFDEKDRQRLLEAAVNQYKFKEKFRGETSPLYNRFCQLSQAKNIANLTGKLGDIRNDLAHTEMRSQPQSASDLIDLAKLQCNRVCELANVLLPAVI